METTTSRGAFIFFVGLGIVGVCGAVYTYVMSLLAPFVHAAF